MINPSSSCCGVWDYLSSYAVNSPAIADNAKGTATTTVTDVIVKHKYKSDAIQIDMHHSQVKKYPIFEDSGGNFFQTLFLMKSVITSRVISLVRR
jgi:hypothetical protein